MTSTRLLLADYCKLEDDEIQMKGKPYRSRIGGLGLLCSVGVQSDMAFETKELARFNDKAGPGHWNELIIVLQYLRNNINRGIIFYKEEDSS